MRHDTFSGISVREDDFLRGACHALASLESTGLTPAQTLTECQRLRAQANMGRPVPPLMWHLGMVSTGRDGDDAILEWRRQTEDDDGA